jgi:hypothetical protein
LHTVAYGESEVKLFGWYDKLFNLKYLPLFHHFKAIYQFPKHIIFLIKIVANASLTICIPQYNNSFLHFRLASPLHRQSWWVKPALVQIGYCTYERSQIVGVTVRLVEEQSLRRYQRVTIKKSQGRLAELWDKYEAKTIKTSDFLRSVGNIYATAVSTSQDSVSES